MVAVAQVVAEFKADFSTQTEQYRDMYSNLPNGLDEVSAAFHEQINEQLQFLNSKIRTNRHFNAANSRALILLIDNFNKLRGDLKRAGIDMVLRLDYKNTLWELKGFLVESGGSSIPDGFKEVQVERYEPVLSVSGWAPSPPTAPAPQKLRIVGEGAFARVHRYEDETYGITIAQKSAKPGIDPRDLERFRTEFKLLKGLDFPYIVQAYSYDDNTDSFTMEYCDTTLGDYIKKENSQILWSTRKRVALQFLYGLNYLHSKEILHRDISLNNVLVKRFDRGAVLVKLSDFGLHKAPDSEFTRIETELKGSIIDPTLPSFKEFAKTNDLYAAGVVLSYIFTGRKGLGNAAGKVGDVVRRATDHTVENRFSSIGEMIRAVENIQDVGTARNNGSPD
ncbi:protein kinase-like protein [Mycolicibacterium mucogenicum 261Sha1.1M5]|nr:protein kinase-like protein [Mycolicibacterium mucogenicum 261Sha1.1M5]